MYRCDTCKRRRGVRCAVLLEMIGRKKDCSFWTDDPDWERKADAAVAAYKLDFKVSDNSAP